MTFAEGDELMFIFHIEGESKERDYNSKHLRYLLGVSKEEIPTVRILHYQSERTQKIYLSKIAFST